MAVNAQAVVNVNVNAKPFDDFMEEFNKYVKLLGQTPAAWAKMSSQQKAMVVTMNQGVAALMAQNAIMRKNALAASDLAKHSEASAFHWDKIRDRAGKFLGFVVHAHEHIMKWAGIIGGVITGMGAASGWGLYGLGQWVRSGSIASSKVGMSAGQLGAAKTLIGEPFGVDVEGIAKKVNTAAGDPSSREKLEMSVMGVNDPASLRGTDKIAVPLLALIQQLKAGLSPQILAQRTGMDPQELTAIKEKIPEIEAAIAKLHGEAEKQEVKPKTEKAWNDFITQISSATEQLKTILAEGLEPLLKHITKNSPLWLAGLKKFMDSKEWKKFLEDVPGYVEGIWAATRDFLHVLEWLALRMHWIKRSEEDEKKYQAELAKRAAAKGVSPQVLEKQETADAAAGVVKGGVDWTLEGTRKNRADFTAQVEAGAEARRTERKTVEDALIKKFDEFFTYLRTGKQPEGSHQEGSPYVRKTGSYTLHQGEMVLPEADADLLRHSTMADWKRSISGIEGGYKSVNPVTGASGKYQVMPGNIPAWTQAALGHSMSVAEFRASPAAQERVFEYMFTQYVQKFGNPLDAASAWFTGRPIAGNKAGPDAMGTTLQGYLRQFIQGLGGGGGGMAVNINDNTGGNVAIQASQMATIGLQAYPV